MRRTLLLTALLGLGCSGAMAVTFHGTPTDVATNTITIGCAIGTAYANIGWEDLSIDFTAGTGAAADYFSASPTDWHQVTTGEKVPTDAEATGDYEALDTASVAVKSNTAIKMTVAESGALRITGHSIPTTFSVAATPYLSTNPRIGGVDLTRTDLRPGTVLGTYATAGSGTMAFNGATAWPGAAQFATTGSGTWDAALGTGATATDARFKFFARIHRDGLNDPVGNYATTLTVTFASP